MQQETFIGGTPPVERRAFKFGKQKINLHVKGKGFESKAHLPVPGALDLCFTATVPLEEVVEKLQRLNVAIVEAPVMRTGATSRIRSVYVRDPDLNLIVTSLRLAVEFLDAPSLRRSTCRLRPSACEGLVTLRRRTP